MSIYMGTIPRENVSKTKLFKFFEYYDIHKWIVGREEGKNGYKHWQVRFQTTAFDSDEGWEELKDWFKTGHFEKASDEWSYETKSGDYFTSRDNKETIQLRFGRLTEVQKRVLQAVRITNNREIVVWYTDEGGCGKSHLCGALWERRIAHYVIPQGTAKSIIQDVASEVLNNGDREMIVIDIPRTWKWTEEMYCAIETIKDGLVKDPRYSSRTINIRGTKLLILCNHMPKLGKLSADRWVVLEGPQAWRASLT